MAWKNLNAARQFQINGKINLNESSPFDSLLLLPHNLGKPPTLGKTKKRDFFIITRLLQNEAFHLISPILGAKLLRLLAGLLELLNALLASGSCKNRVTPKSIDSCYGTACGLLHSVSRLDIQKFRGVRENVRSHLKLGSSISSDGVEFPNMNMFCRPDTECKLQENGFVPKLLVQKPFDVEQTNLSNSYSNLIKKFD